MRTLSLIVATLLALALLPSAAMAVHVTPARVQGETRYHTAASIAQLTFSEAGVAHVVTGETFADALAASFAAGRTGGPVLLTQREQVPAPTLAALDALGVTRVVLIGGTGAISQQVQDDLVARGYDVERIQGVNRYQTASSVAMRYGGNGHVGTLENLGRTAMITSGVDFPDALAAGPVAAFMHFPLFLTPPERTEASVSFSLSELEIDHVIIVGGTGAVSTEVETSLRNQGYTTERLSGTTRTATAVDVADFTRNRLGWETSLQLLARGDDYPDALAASVHASTRTAPILLTADPNTLGQPTRVWLHGTCPVTDAVRALGGENAVTTATLDQAVQAANGCDHVAEDERVRPTFGVSPQEPIEHQPGQAHEFGVFARYDDQPFTGPIDIALFPCADVEALANPPRFSDDDGDGLVDGFGRTDTNAARITSVNGAPTDTTVVRDVSPAGDGVLRFVLDSQEVDCAVPVAFDDEDNDGQPDIDDDGHMVEPYGLSRIRWDVR